MSLSICRHIPTEPRQNLLLLQSFWHILSGVDISISITWGAMKRNGTASHRVQQIWNSVPKYIIQVTFMSFKLLSADFIKWKQLRYRSGNQNRSVRYLRYISVEHKRLQKGSDTDTTYLQGPDPKILKWTEKKSLWIVKCIYMKMLVTDTHSIERLNPDPHE